jgi:hypothetical protein
LKKLKLITVVVCSYAILGLQSCVDPFSISTPDNPPTITVDGLLSTDLGPHSVRITRTDKYGSVFEGAITTVNDANVAIRDNEGNVTFLEEFVQDSATFFFNGMGTFVTREGIVFPQGSWVTYFVGRKTGIYRTPINFRAEVGKTYTLQILLLNGESYSSEPQKVLPVAPIEDVSILTYTRPSANPLEQSSGATIQTKFTDPADETNFYFWRVANPVYTFITDLEGASCCDVCFRYDDAAITNTFAIQDDTGFNGITTNLPTISIGDDGFRFKDRLRVDFNQYSTVAAGHRYLRLIKQQLDLKGSVFDPLPANIRGNMFNVNDPNKQVLGYFFVSDVSTRTVYIRNSDLTFTQTPGVVLGDCREAKGFSRRLTTTAPSNWSGN